MPLGGHGAHRANSPREFCQKTAVSKVAKPAVKAKKTAPAKKVSPKTEDRKLKGSK